MLEVHDRLGQISAASGRAVQLHEAFNNGDQSLHDVDSQRERERERERERGREGEREMPLIFFYPEYEGQKTSPQSYVKEAVRRKQELNELSRRNTAQNR